VGDQLGEFLKDENRVANMPQIRVVPRNNSRHKKSVANTEWKPQSNATVIAK